MSFTHADIARWFKEAAANYLSEQKPKYRGRSFKIREKDLQKCFAMKLIDKNVAFQRERLFPNSKQRKDFKIYHEDHHDQTHVEVEWYATWHDSFATSTPRFQSSLARTSNN
jgi:hypothetical protein